MPVWLIALLVTAACAAHKPNEIPAPKTGPLPVTESASATPSAPSAEKKPEPPPEPTAEQRAQAAAFDKFVMHKLSDAEEKALHDACQKKGDSSPFCFAVMNYDQLEAKLNARPARREPRTRVRPGFAGKTIANWEALRADTIGHLVKSFSRASKRNVAIARDAALAETKCPNNAAIAIAATLEDGLPGADAGVLASLYEKGGDCLTNPDDKENNLTRAGLFYYLKKDFAKAAVVWKRSGAIDAAKSPRALYWLYRVRGELGDKAGATDALARLREKFPFSFHTVMGRLREGEDPDDILVSNEPSVKKRSSKVPTVNALMEEAELLVACNLPKSASKVLDWAILLSEGAEPEFRLYLVELKKDRSESRPAMLLLSKLLIDNPGLTSRKTLGLYFPKAYFDLFEKHAEGLDPYFLLAVARQESAFDPKAVSPARAKGLLQIARGKGKGLFDPGKNIATGARLFSRLFNQNNGRIYLALSGYNAGPRHATEWARRYETRDPILFIDLIPYKETRAYVALILRNYYWYHRLHHPTEVRLPWIALSESEKALWLGTPSIAAKTAH